jgi:hypothetical protein
MSRRLGKAAVLAAGAAALAMYWWGQRGAPLGAAATGGNGWNGKRRRRRRSGRRPRDRAARAARRRAVPVVLQQAALRVLTKGVLTKCAAPVTHGNLWLRIVEAQELSNGRAGAGTTATATAEPGLHQVWRALRGLGPHGDDRRSLRGDVYGWHCRAATPPTTGGNDDNVDSCRRVESLRLSSSEYESQPSAAGIDTRAVDQIDRDVGRTFPRHPFFAQMQGYGQCSLRRVLVAWVSWEREYLHMVNGEGCEGMDGADEHDDINTDDDHIVPPILTPTAYVQGMNMIVGHFLKHVDEPRAFRLFCHIMVNPLYNFRHIVCPGMPGLFLHHHVLEHLIDQHIPAVAHVLLRAKLSVVLFSTEWILTLFAYVFDGKFLNVFLDRFFGFGWPAFYQVALALLESRLQDMESAMGGSVPADQHYDGYASPNEGVLSIVKGIGRRRNYGDAQSGGLNIEEILERALHFDITNEDIDALAEEHEQQQQQLQQQQQQQQRRQQQQQQQHSASA